APDQPVSLAYRTDRGRRPRATPPRARTNHMIHYREARNFTGNGSVPLVTEVPAADQPDYLVQVRVLEKLVDDAGRAFYRAARAAGLVDCAAGVRPTARQSKST